MNTIIKVFLCITAGTILLGLLSGCKGGSGSEIYVRNSEGQRPRIAVIPFDNASHSQEAGQVVTSTIVTYLLSTGLFDVVDPGVVSSTLTGEGIRTDNMSSEAYQKLQTKLNVDALIIGLVEDYGEVRVGPETYPSISFSARLVDSRTSEILWAATISKTGDENVSLFDIGRVNSLGKLSKMAVASMADSLIKSKQKIIFGLKPVPAIDTTQKPAPDTTQKPVPTDSAQAPNKVSPPAVSGKYLDESPSYGEKELTALLKDVSDMKLGEIQYSSHWHDTISTQYQLSNGKQFIEAKLVDYRKVDTAPKFLATNHPDDKQITFEGMLAYGVADADYPYYHLDIAIGRFGLYLKGPKDQQSNIETLGKGIIGLLK